MSNNTKLTKQELHEFLEYVKLTGNFKWSKTSSKNKRFLIGKDAGCVNKSTGYLVIKIKGEHHLAHRLVWLYHYGEFPEQAIDHIDMDKLNNKVENLRLATSQENQHNRGKTKDCTSLFVGVSFRAREQKWRAAYQTVEGVRKHIGYFTSEIDAALAVEALMRKERGVFFNEHNSVDSILKRKQA